MSTDAQIIPFPSRPSCFRCSWFDGKYCSLFEEVIESEIYAAQDCVEYDPVP